MSEYKRLRVLGHKLTRRNYGCPTGYCECGEWSFTHKVSKVTAVIRGHNGHLRQVIKAKARIAALSK